MCLVRIWSFLYSDFITGVLVRRLRQSSSAVMKISYTTYMYYISNHRHAKAPCGFKAHLFSNSPSLSESESSRGGMRTRIWRRSLWTTSCSFPLDFSISFPASCRERFSVTVPLIYTHVHNTATSWKCIFRCLILRNCICLGETIYEWGKAQCEFFRNFFIQKINITLQQN